MVVLVWRFVVFSMIVFLFDSRFVIFQFIAHLYDLTMTHSPHVVICSHSCMKMRPGIKTGACNQRIVMKYWHCDNGESNSNEKPLNEEGRAYVGLLKWKNENWSKQYIWPMLYRSHRKWEWSSSLCQWNEVGVLSNGWPWRCCSIHVRGALGSPEKHTRHQSVVRNNRLNQLGLVSYLRNAVVHIL
jgi:hypothetical protein